jgi:hypothetical protein
LIDGNKSLLRLTPRGARALAAATVPDAGRVELAELIARWPPLDQQAFSRLAIGEVVAHRFVW